MSFVAQPYELFVDDLLTALTGGMIREEHQFAGSDRAYSLGSPARSPTACKVIGQRNERVRVFERGVDYDYDAEEDASRWHARRTPAGRPQPLLRHLLRRATASAGSPTATRAA